MIERIERDDDGLAVRHREGDENDRERYQDERRDDPADHGRGVRRGAHAPARLRRSRISLPVLKNGTAFFSTDTWAPVRGLRPVRAGRFLTENAPKPRNSTRSPCAIAATISLRMALMMFSTSR